METKAHGHGEHSHSEGHDNKTYILIWGALIILTVITVSASYIHFGIFNIVIALVIASIKASLVALFFMHLKYEDKITWAFALYPLFLLAILISSGLIDLFFSSGLPLHQP